MWLGEKRFGSNLGPSVVRVSKTRIVKGPCERAELEGLKYVAEHSSISVPTVHQTYCVDGHLYIEMEYIQGDNLQDLWIKHGLSLTKKHAIVKHVAAYINQLRLLEPPRNEEGVVASAGLGPGLDIRVGHRNFDPFSAMMSFTLSSVDRSLWSILARLLVNLSDGAILANIELVSPMGIFARVIS